MCLLSEKEKLPLFNVEAENNLRQFRAMLLSAQFCCPVSMRATICCQSCPVAFKMSESQINLQKYCSGYLWNNHRVLIIGGLCVTAGLQTVITVSIFFLCAVQTKN